MFRLRRRTDTLLADSLTMEENETQGEDDARYSDELCPECGNMTGSTDVCASCGAKRMTAAATPDKVQKVMHEFKAGRLRLRGKKGKPGARVTDRKQAVAIALSEAGRSTTADAGEVMAAAPFRAPFDESKYRRKPKGTKGGGQFTVKENAAGRFEVVDDATGKKVAETTTEVDAQTVADEKNAAPVVDTNQIERTRRIANLANAGARGETRADGPSHMDYSPEDLRTTLRDSEDLTPEGRANIERTLALYEDTPITDAQDQAMIDSPGINYARMTEADSNAELTRLYREEIGKLSPNVYGLQDPADPAAKPRFSSAQTDYAKGRARKRLMEMIDAAQRTENAIAQDKAQSDFFSASADGTEAIIASIPVQPPQEWFANPELDGPTPITVTSDGRIYGHAAVWGTCHLGNPRGAGVCVQPPRSQTDYALFHLGEIETDGGGRVPVGQITLDTGHAPLGASARTAAAHYDDTGTVVADVMAGEDEHGIYFAGALRPDVTPERLRKLTASKISGDWRGGELVGMLAVNVPGFPVPRTKARLVADASGTEEVLALVAAGIVGEREIDARELEIRVQVLAARAEGGIEALAELAER